MTHVKVIEKQGLSVFEHLPFLCWIKRNQIYVYGNQAINEFAGENVVGKKDAELIWGSNATMLLEAGTQAIGAGEAQYLHETVDHSKRGKVTLSVCKFPVEFEGEICAMGISFIIE
ncbi:hypothetical protein [Shewanella surugensis]|uniref:PAS fold-4 domain-containing protein n=1 Tax=Shewanella surugensis TaxID=212020 RepID=A0ABT0L7L1_9GAMM|nr:hypothetical protein [Shewanella surugensis]MCL1123495.1 hypothetical protein [Shewanella surugensis]